MHTQRIVVAISAGVGVVCTFLPWAQVPLLGSVGGTELQSARAWVALAACSAALLVTLLGTVAEPLTSGATLLCALAGVTATGIAVWTIIEFAEAARGTMFGSVQIGVGLYLLAVAGLIVAFVPGGARRVAAAPGTQSAPGGAR